MGAPRTHIPGEHRCAVVGAVVSRELNLEAAAISRNASSARKMNEWTAFGFVVQHRALRVASLALDLTALAAIVLYPISSIPKLDTCSS